jgi:hypothetical protein
MNIFRTAKISFLLIAFLLVFNSFCFSVEYGWEFEEGKEGTDWGGTNIHDVSIEKGGLVIKGVGNMILVSPSGLRFSYPAKMLWMRIEATTGGPGMVVLIKGKGADLRKDFTIKRGVRDYRIYLGNLPWPESYIERLMLLFPPQGTGGQVTIDFVRFPEPSSLQLLLSLWAWFWEPDTIKDSTINHVTTPQVGTFSFLTALYVLITVLSTGVVLVSVVRKGALTAGDVVRAIMICFLAVGVLFAFRMDYNWLKIWQNDRASLSATSVNERIPPVFYIEKQFFDFISFVEGNVPEGEKVRPAVKSQNDIYASLARYYLLPVRTSKDGSYLWVYNESDVHFDPAGRSLMKKDKTIASPVELVAVYRPGAALYKTAEEGER